MRNETLRKARAVFDLVFDGSNASIFKNPQLYEDIERSWAFRRPQLAEATARFIDGRTGSGSRILDVAAGTGMLTHSLQRLGHDVTGLDFNEPMLRGMLDKSSGSHPEAIVADMNKGFPFKKGSFDAVTTLRANRFIHGTSFYGESFRVLENGGILVVPVFSIDVPFWKKESGFAQQTSVRGVTEDLHHAGFHDVQTIPGRKALNGANIPPYYVPTYLVARK